MTVSPSIPDRAQWRQVVCHVTQTLRHEYPVQSDTIDEAEKLVLGGHVTEGDDGTYAVRSQHQPDVIYTIQDSRCTCDAFKFAPHERCKHLWAALVCRRACTTCAQREETTPTLHPGVRELPDAAVSTRRPEVPVAACVTLDVSGRTVRFTLRDHSDDLLIRRVRKLVNQFPAAPIQETFAFSAPNEQPEVPSGQDHCRLHGVKMTQHSKNGQSWFSHYTETGWCRGKGKV